MTKKNKSFEKVNLNNKREVEESYLEYRKRLKENYYKVKYYIKGELFWDSLADGTYFRERKNDLS